MATGAQKRARADAIYKDSQKAFKQGKHKKSLRLFRAYLKIKPCGYPQNTAEFTTKEKGAS